MRITYLNRYKTSFTFEKNSKGNIKWHGDFDFCRIGYPNDYTKAYNVYISDVTNGLFKDELMTLDSFKVAVHKYDDEKREYVMGNKYVRLVESVKDQISMVDPSGGPYLTIGSQMEQFGKEFKGIVVKGFKSTKKGFIIITK